MANTFYGLEDIELFPYPNPALANILLGARLKGIMADYTARVLSLVLVKQAASQTPYSDPGRQFRKGGHRPGQLIEQTSASIDVGSAMPGLPADRWVGNIQMGVVYGGSTVYGRHAYAEYKGNRVLQEALFAVVPPI